MSIPHHFGGTNKI